MAPMPVSTRGISPRFQLRHVVAAVLFALAFNGPAYAEGVGLTYMYKLSDFTGMIPFNSARMFADRQHQELYVVGTDNSVRIFSESGMEIYQFNDDGSLGIVYDAVADKDGDILVLSYSPSSVGTYSIIRCNYRGDRLGNVDLKNLPKEFSEDFHPSALAYQAGRLYLADQGSMKIVVTDDQGLFERGVDIIAALKIDEKRSSMDLAGFSVDKGGNILFTIPVRFKAFRLAPDGQLVSFGERGGAPGKFNITSGIVSDDDGHYYVVDKLKCAVLIFDRNFKFLTQAGYRGWDDGGLIAPTGLAILDNKLYISQMGRRGISVFAIRQ